MTTNPLTEKLKKIFIEEAYGKPTIDNYELGTRYKSRLFAKTKELKFSNRTD